MSNPLEMLEVINENDNVVGLENRAKIHQEGVARRVLDKSSIPTNIQLCFCCVVILLKLTLLICFFDKKQCVRIESPVCESHVPWGWPSAICSCSCTPACRQAGKRFGAILRESSSFRERQGAGMLCQISSLHSNTKEPSFSHTGVWGGIRAGFWNFFWRADN